MGGVTFLFEYLVWHYSRAVKDIVRLSGNFLGAVFNFFSIPFLLKTLFVPFERLQEKKKSLGFDAEEFFGNLIVTTIMRIVGAVVRLITIAFGFILLIVVSAISIVSFVGWLLLPILVPLSFTYGIGLLFS